MAATRHLIDSEEWDVHTLSAPTDARIADIELTEEKLADYVRVMREFAAWQDLLRESFNRFPN